MRFTARVTAGLEEIAALDRQVVLPDAEIESVQWRRIDFRLEQGCERVLALAGVDDVYLAIDELQDIGHTREELAALREYATGLDFGQLLGDLEAVRGRPEEDFTFYVTASRVGEHNYSSTDLQAAFREGIASAAGWPAVTEYSQAALNFRVIVEHDRLFIGLSAAEHPLHRRDYKICHLPGSLSPPVAHLLARISGCGAGETLLDPMCGAGTILIEAQKLDAELRVIGSDMSARAVGCACQNWRQAYPERDGELFAADVDTYPLSGEMVTRFISNPPWGRQVDRSADLYGQYMDMLRQVGAPGFVCVLITDQTQALMQAVQAAPDIALLWVRQISLFGAYPVICVLGGPEWVGREGQAFRQFSPLGEGISRLIDQQGVWQSYARIKSG